MLRVVRARSPQHFADIEALQRTILPGDEPHSTSAGVWWVVYDVERPVAFAGLSPSKRWAATFYLCRAGVAPSHRGAGLQKRLIRLREREARRLGAEWLITDTIPGNPASSNSLIRCGFKLFSPQAPWRVQGALYWRKRLTA